MNLARQLDREREANRERGRQARITTELATELLESGVRMTEIQRLALLDLVQERQESDRLRGENKKLQQLVSDLQQGNHGAK